MKKGCTLICCPQCGYEMVNIQQSKIVQMVRRFLPRKRETSMMHNHNLGEIKPGEQAKVLGFNNAIPMDKRSHRQSYGLIPGKMVRVIQHSPVTIIQVEHTELAIEREMAKEIQVDVP